MTVVTGIERKLEQNGVALTSFNKSTISLTTAHSLDEAVRLLRAEERVV
jgi:hypothetical protein